MLLQQILLGVIGISSGLIVSAGVFTEDFCTGRDGSVWNVVRWISQRIQ